MVIVIRLRLLAKDRTVIDYPSPAHSSNEDYDSTFSSRPQRPQRRRRSPPPAPRPRASSACPAPSACAD